MKRAARYNPRENGGQIQTFLQVSKPKRWCVAIDIQPAEPQAARIKLRMNLKDKLMLRDIHDLALDTIKNLLPEHGQVAEASMDFWVEA